MQNQQKQASKRPYTGVDKLILAAMMEDRAAAIAAAASAASSYMPSGRGIGYFGQTRDTYAQIPKPGNKSELELYRLLERANLLIYFGTFLNFGGDDVQQLSDADEEEFLEIMSLVGMTQKPLHVRRLQKALIEWREMKDSESLALRSLMNQNSSIGSNYTNNSTNPMTDSCTFATSSPSKSFGSEQDSHNPQYAHQVLIGAPKRLRLMDDLHRRDDKKPEDAPRMQSESPKSQRSVDKDEDKLIEVMESSHSDLEPDNNDEASSVTTALAKATCSSPSQTTTEVSHSKYGRYRASLQAPSVKQSSLPC